MPSSITKTGKGHIVQATSEMETAVQAGWNVEVFFDGDCPLCQREISMLKRRDCDEKIRFTDIAAEDFDPADVGRTHDELMARIHGRLPDGSIIEGVEVFRKLYHAIGFRWLVLISRIPGISHLLRLGYWAFAKNRLRLTGRRCDANGCRT